ncbi:L-type lectin-domain containing receptor kinase IX.1-like [Papaver somniferum]|uniref:L-type lectin-domain containing receptor kinase IX.1-like n=1 Tax=Papaver somniferum TaxID=3469 RepID=UPI000E6FE6BC|nr:L-type lectin-domain containing receptor kinase IX.1-like [Papaver somniferum]
MLRNQYDRDDEAERHNAAQMYERDERERRKRRRDEAEEREIQEAMRQNRHDNRRQARLKRPMQQDAYQIMREEKLRELEEMIEMMTARRDGGRRQLDEALEEAGKTPFEDSYNSQFSTEKLCIEVTVAGKIAYISEELCIGCGICVKVLLLVTVAVVGSGDNNVVNGLDSHLFGRRTPLTWAVRYKIALGLASALLYLHEEGEQCVVHRDIKSSNIMLDSYFNAKLGDFGLARLMDHELGLQSTGLAGTLGYLAPEYISSGKASKESDAFSFGVVALEIACGRKSMDYMEEVADVGLVEWVWDLYGRDAVLAAIDHKLNLEFDANQAECLMVVGLWCAHPDRSFRPSIRQAIQVLNMEASIPTLLTKMPVPSYHVPELEIISSERNSITAASIDIGR